MSHGAGSTGTINPSTALPETTWAGYFRNLGSSLCNMLGCPTRQTTNASAAALFHDLEEPLIVRYEENLRLGLIAQQNHRLNPITSAITRYFSPEVLPNETIWVLLAQGYHAVKLNCKNPAFISGLIFATISMVSYFATANYSAKSDFGDSKKGQELAILSSMASSIVNGILFYLTGVETWENWGKISWAARGLRIGLMALSVLPSLIMLSSVLRSTASWNPGLSWTISVLMTILRDVLNARALEGMNISEPSGRPHKIINALVYHCKQIECSWNGLKHGSIIATATGLTAAALIYTFAEHSRVSEALGMVTEAMPFLPSYTSLSLQYKYAIEYFACLLLAPLNATWALAGITAKDQISALFSPWRTFKLMVFEFPKAILDLSIQVINALLRKDSRYLVLALYRSNKDLIDGMLTALVAGSSFPAITLAFAGATRSPDSTTFDWEATSIAQLVIQIIAGIIGVEMNFSSTFIWRNGEDLDALYGRGVIAAIKADEISHGRPCDDKRAIEIRMQQVRDNLAALRGLNSAASSVLYRASPENTHPVPTRLHSEAGISLPVREVLQRELRELRIPRERKVADGLRFVEPSTAPTR